MTTRTAPTPPSSRLAQAVGGVRTQMGHRRVGHRQLAAVGDALRAFRAADRLLHTHPQQLGGLHGGS